MTKHKLYSSNERRATRTSGEMSRLSLPVKCQPNSDVEAACALQYTILHLFSAVLTLHSVQFGCSGVQLFSIPSPVNVNLARTSTLTHELNVFRPPTTDADPPSPGKTAFRAVLEPLTRLPSSPLPSPHQTSLPAEACSASMALDGASVEQSLLLDSDEDVFRIRCD